MCFDIFDLVALLGIRLHDMLHHVLGLLVNVAGHEVLARENLLVQLVGI